MGDVVDISAALRPGVYVLYRGGKVVYVGQSQCPLVRIYTHRACSGRKVPSWLTARGVRFDRVEVIPTHPDRLDEAEQALIAFYRPPGNVRHVPPAPNLPRLVTRRL